MQRIITLTDVHAPFHDPAAIELATKFARDLKPTELVIHEWCDWYSISKFSKDPNRKETLQDDLDMTVKLLTSLRKSFPDIPITMLHSNHDARLKKYLASEAKGLSSLRCLTIHEQLKLKSLDIEYKPHYFFRRTLLFKHGDYISQDSAYTAKKELMREGVSGCSGHTHRLGVYWRSNRVNNDVWIENGCLCSLQPTWVKGPVNWQNGVGVFTFKDGKKHFHPGYAQIINGEILHGDKLYTL